MKEFLFGYLLFGLYFLATAGWGTLLARFAYPKKHLGFAFRSALGMGCLIFIGGILNVLSIAYAPVVASVFLSGIVLLAYLGLRGGQFKKLAANRLGILKKSKYSAAYVITAVFGTFLIYYLLPSAVFNQHDDFHTYFVRVVRMLQIGTQAGNPFDIIGVDTLGAPAFMHGFSVLTFGLPYLNAFDAVFCVVLSALLLIELASGLGAPSSVATAAVLTLILINPQSVNISPIYSGVAILLALIIAVYFWLEDCHEQDSKGAIRLVTPIGLLLGTLVSLKITLAPAGAVFLAICLGLYLFRAKSRRKALVSSGFAIAVSIFSVLPWLLAHLPKYLILLGLREKVAGSEAGSEGPFQLSKQGNVSDYFTNNELHYGDSMSNYNSLVVLLALGAIAGLVWFVMSGKKEQKWRLSLLLFASSISGILTYGITAMQFFSQTAIRYSCPVLLAAVSGSVLLISTMVYSGNTGKEKAGRKNPSNSRPFSTLLIYLPLILIVAMFHDTFIGRLYNWNKLRTVIMFPVSEHRKNYSHAVLAESTNSPAYKVQLLTEPGETIAAWISVPFRLDYRRNDVKFYADPSTTCPWLEVPFDGKPETARKYFLGHGIRYIMWEHAGFGIKSAREYLRMVATKVPLYVQVANYGLSMHKALRAISKKGGIVKFDNRFVLIDLEVPPNIGKRRHCSVGQSICPHRFRSAAKYWKKELKCTLGFCA